MNTTSATPTAPDRSGNPGSTDGLYRREIAYDRETTEYAMFMDGELIGYARTYGEAERTLDALAFELLSGQYFREAA